MVNISGLKNKEDGNEKAHFDDSNLVTFLYCKRG
jgi:hypothetical protein